MRSQSSSLSVMDFTPGSSHGSVGDDDENHEHRAHGVSIAPQPDLTMNSSRILQNHLAFMVRSLQDRVSRLEEKYLDDKTQTGDATAIDEIKSQISQLQTNQKALKVTNEIIQKQLKDMIKVNYAMLGGIDSIRAKLDAQAKSLKPVEGLAERQVRDDILPVWERSRYDIFGSKLEQSKPLVPSERFGLLPSPHDETYEDFIRRRWQHINAKKAQFKDTCDSLSRLSTDVNDKEDRSTIVPSTTASEKLASPKSTLAVPDHGLAFPMLPTDHTSVRERVCSVCYKVNCTFPSHGRSDWTASIVVPRAPRASHSLADIRCARRRGAESMDS
ncbi:hypothetical protein MCOR25_008534 [Pyricularia grisea]|nr:hypothetical protein MCOR25_008534 [Pyricularia grisea]